MVAAIRGDPSHEPPAVELPNGLFPFRRSPVRGLGLWILVECLTANKWGWHAHDQWQIVFVFTPGVCEAAWRSPTGRPGRRRLTGGHVWIVPPGWSHSIRWREKADMIVLYVDAAQMEQGGRLPRQVVIAALADYVALQAGIADLCADLRKFGTRPHGDSDWRVASAGSDLGANFLETHRRLGQGVPKPRHPLEARIFAAVRAFAMQPQKGRVPVARLAREVGSNPRTFRRLFREITGESPQRWTLGHKARQAKSLLQSGCSIKATVAQGGFSDPRHLNRVLQAVFGVTASALQPRASRPLQP